MGSLAPQSVLARLFVTNPTLSDRFIFFFLVFSVRDYLQLLQREFEFPRG